MNCVRCGAVDERCACRTTPTVRPGSSSSVKRLDDDAILGLVDEALARAPHEAREADRIRFELVYGSPERRAEAIRALLVWRARIGLR